MSRWNGQEGPPPSDGLGRTVTLTKRGMIAAICAAAEPFVVPACRVTVYDTTTAIVQARGERTLRARPCGEHVHRDGLCRRHAADRERLTTSGTQRGAEAIHRAFVTDATEPRMVAAGVDSGVEGL